MKIFRFDDICINTDMAKANSMADYIYNFFDQKCTILFCVSPLVHVIDDKRENQEHVFPDILVAYSDYKVYYKTEDCGIPKIEPYITRSSHGLVHADHRLLSKGAQEMSILLSCSLIKCDIFVPPFNKWNKDTEEICTENNIHLVKFEDGWLSIEHNDYSESHDKWYFHSMNMTLDNVKDWLK